MLRHREFSKRSTIVGFDAEGYSIVGRHQGWHIAPIKGVIADLLPYETGATRVSLAIKRISKSYTLREQTWSSRPVNTALRGSGSSIKFKTVWSFPSRSIWTA